MPLRESLQHLLGRGDGGKESKERQIDIAFWDVRDLEEAKGRRVEPGFYFTIDPVSEEEFSSPTFLYGFTPHFYKALFAENLVGRSDIQIPLDNEGNFTDPSSSWRFACIGYIKDLYMAVVRAEPMDSQKAQLQTIKAIKGKKYTISLPNLE